MKVTIVNGSPHIRGVTDSIIYTVQSCIAQSHIILARDYDMRPCIHCGYCKSNVVLEKQYSQGCCTITKDDDVILFSHFLASDAIIWVAPIYFYHMPALVKAIIDRSQALYYMKKKENSYKRFFPILHSGRECGKKLFEGSLLTLKYFVEALGFVSQAPLLLRGTDNLSEEKEKKREEEIQEYCLSITENMLTP